MGGNKYGRDGSVGGGKQDDYGDDIEGRIDVICHEQHGVMDRGARSTAGGINYVEARVVLCPKSHGCLAPGVDWWSRGLDFSQAQNLASERSRLSLTRT